MSAPYFQETFDNYREDEDKLEDEEGDTDGGEEDDEEGENEGENDAEYTVDGTVELDEDANDDLVVAETEGMEVGQDNAGRRVKRRVC